MKRILAVLCLILILGSGPDRDPRPAEPFCPPAWDDAIIFAQSFNSPDGKPEVQASGLELKDPTGAAPGGWRGRCGHGGLTLSSEAGFLSPHRPLTIMFWWAVREDIQKDGAFDLIYLRGASGFIGHFARGGADGWCGLSDTAGVVQIYYLPGIADVNGIYDREFREHLDLRKGVWHHAALVISAATLVSAYIDGRLVFECRAQGRSFRPDDGFRTLSLGGSILLDEVLILSCPLAGEEIADYVSGFRQMRLAYGRDGS